MKRITKQILATSVTGTLALMGAPPEKRMPDSSVEVSAAEVTIRGVIVMEGTTYFIKDARTGVKHELKLISADLKDVPRLQSVIGTEKIVTGKFVGNKAVIAASRSIFSEGKNAAAAKGIKSGGKTGTAAALGTAAAGGTAAGLYASGTIGEKEEKSASRP